ncbi:hypothetical protein A2704_05060 [Candidatus Kaiserbacteria bacterium RIFCSPHIGHO2_01_FULL_54_36b]|uniref:Acylneuraminate cytidylyltransferase n=1 Tax=Candidatus Kaiserbacteria bacterium RIFCSPHIGHO2_01_FULL_54_36b TaxID=1798483 RepID=A0A1F6CNB5_9BACT|nr:MAG: hypothetical protein A2704_05060 [Candidatus Kaiserbacteria bacterium RIFCSPHIGHO2_01_FULL_54_36b]
MNVSPIPLNILGVVGARSGSKSLPNKNILPLLGKPMMSWIIGAAKRSSLITRVVLSTDSPAYAEIGRQYGAETPFMRPPELCGDLVPDFDWLYHAATWLHSNEGWKADIIVRLAPTFPLCKTADIDACLQLLIDHPEADSCYTVIEAPKHPYKMWKMKDDVYIEPIFPDSVINLKDVFNQPRQLLPRAYVYIDASAIRWRTLVEEKRIAGGKVLPYLIADAVDVDHVKDFEKAEEILRSRMGESTE